MGRSSKRKKGKSAKAARRGLLGLSATAIGKKKSRQFEKRQEQRQRKKDERQTEEILRENVSGPIKDESRPPHSFIIHTGRVGRYVRQLERDLRKVMSPNTSETLKVTKRNNFKDFVVNSQYLGVTHLLVLSRSPLSVNFRIIRNPQGPTIHFKVEKYSLARDVLASQKRPVIYEELFDHPPLVVLNGFTVEGKKHLQLAQTLIQNMFPTIDMDKIKLATIRRALLLQYSAEDDLIDFRQYSIKAVPAGVSRSVKKLLQNKIPDLSKYEDICDFVLKPGQLSDSEFEGEQVELELPQDIGGPGKKKGQRTKIRLIEIGPRMSLRLTKIEEGINDGEVLYHAFVEKSVKELAMLRKQALTSRKKRMRLERQVEHNTIRKMRHLNAKEARLDEMDQKQRQSLISKQREVTGDYGGSNSEEEAEERGGGDADDESEEAGKKMGNHRASSSRVQKTSSGRTEAPKRKFGKKITAGVKRPRTSGGKEQQHHSKMDDDNKKRKVTAKKVKKEIGRAHV